MIRKRISIIVLIAFLFSISCGKNKQEKHDTLSKDLLQTKYEKVILENLPFSFEKSTNTKIQTYQEKKKQNWFDLDYPQFSAKIYFSYKPIVNKNLSSLLLETRKMAYQHKVRADAIFEKTYENREKSVYGIVYDITGNSASNLQFVLTDKKNHFVRAALYFNVTPNQDSIAPALKYIKKDMKHLIETFEWKNREK